jgi:RND family efflux transporter MFP subunit
MRTVVPNMLKYHIALLVTVLMLSGCEPSKPVAKAVGVEEVYPVNVAVVRQNIAPRFIEAIGTLRYIRETPVGFLTSGTVTQVQFAEGDYIKRGAVLATIVTSNVVPKMPVVDDRREQAQFEFDRISALYADGWVTKARYEAAKAAVKSGKVPVRQTAPSSSTTKLYAPSNGIVLTRNVEPGQRISAGSPALILGQDDDGFIFRAPVIDKDISKLRIGMAAEIIMESPAKKPITATISEIEGRAKDATDAVIVQFRIPAGFGLRHGQIGKANIALPAAENGAMQIPASALFGKGANEALVYVLDPNTNRIETRNIVIESTTGDYVVVTGSIKPGDNIVVSGGEKLRNGMRVLPSKQP